MIDDGQAEHGGVLQGPPHQVRVGHGRTVVAEGHGPGRGHVRHLGQLLAFPPFGDAAEGKDARRPLRLRCAQDELNRGCGVGSGLGVGHRANGGEAAARRRQRAGGNRLLVLEAGLPQVSVNIDEAGTDHQPRGVDGLRGVLTRTRPDRGHAPVGDEHVGDGVEAVRRVDNTAAADGQGVAHGFPLASR